MSSHLVPSHPALFDPQHILWSILSSYFPASIMKTLRSTPNIHSNELHLLYTILVDCQFRTPDYLFTKIHTLPSHVAGRILSNLEELDIRYPQFSDRDQNDFSVDRIPFRPTHPDCKPLFYTGERETFYFLVQRLFANGYLDDERVGSKRDQVHDFETLHVLYRLGVEHVRSQRNGDTVLKDPNHEWYHETSDALVAQWTRCLRSLAPHARDDDDDSVVITFEPLM